MRKLLSLLLCLCMLTSVLVLAACDMSGSGSGKDNSDGDTSALKAGDTVAQLAGKSPEALYEAALEKVAGLDNYALSSKQTITLKMAGQTSEILQTILTKKDGHNEYVKSENSASTEANMEAWYVNDVLYGKVGSEAFKAEIPYDKYVANFMPQGSGTEGALLNIPESWFADIKFVFVDKNSFCLDFKVKGSEFLSFMSTLGLSESVELSDDQNISYKVFFDKNGELSCITTEFTLSIMGMETSYYTETAITSIGDVKIDPPSNTESWQDKTADLAGTIN